MVPPCYTSKSVTHAMPKLWVQFPGNAWNCIFWIHCKWLYIKAAAKYRNIDMNLHQITMILSLDTIKSKPMVLAQYSSVRLILCYNLKNAEKHRFCTGQKFIGFRSALHAEEARECSASFQVLSWNFWTDEGSDGLLPKLLSSFTSTTKIQHTLYSQKYLVSPF